VIPHFVLIDEKAIQQRVRDLAQRISFDLGGLRPIILGLLRGSFVFMADLVRELSRLGVEPKVDFIAVSHYSVGKDPVQEVILQQETTLDLSGQAILLVDDILDTGKSLAAVIEHLKRLNPGWLRVCVFLDKPSRRTVPVHIDYMGFQVPDMWLIGYGLDLEEEGRALPYIGAVVET
jgi:hypoxanthine phosphoribosyltransferase